MLDVTKRTPRERRFDLFVEIGRLRDDANAMPRLISALRKLLPSSDRRGQGEAEDADRACDDDIDMGLPDRPAIAASRAGHGVSAGAR